ncbi:hypothetical protein Cob_v012800 [Colletotrichum orbiculare MAFF 240422]|uniref:Uncharacterized protein n=1 Tax=Colletotrichum orbiculare (strain 104-T / ATCC 96160 / CBS 514.97 / LARS 414 / MAFF 240422) TaxID=1213857 RepID=N4V348_COLOR|nr:hypothetical protein Cob_v012800 [Colletotrichum orbiculare MAFF 240422]
MLFFRTIGFASLTMLQAVALVVRNPPRDGEVEAPKVVIPSTAHVTGQGSRDKDAPLNPDYTYIVWKKRDVSKESSLHPTDEDKKDAVAKTDPANEKKEEALKKAEGDASVNPDYTYIVW